MPMDFSEALRKLKEGEAVTREGEATWHLSLRIYKWDEKQKIHEHIVERCGSLSPKIWKPSQAEIFATDWLVYPLQNERNQQCQ